MSRATVLQKTVTFDPLIQRKFLQIHCTLAKTVIGGTDFNLINFLANLTKKVEICVVQMALFYF